MLDVLLTTINAKYIHAAFGLRYLFANLGDLKDNAEIMEFDIQTRPIDIAEAILNKNPKIVGIGVYIWNIREVEDLVGILKKVNPEIVIALGGPEVSYEWENQPAVHLCDYLIRGEGDIAFAELCKNILSGSRPESKVISPPLPELNNVKMPYQYYNDEDLKHRIIYVEASRGCPFKCQFCLSSLDKQVRYFPIEKLLGEFKELIKRGGRHFKFVDRTFNVNIEQGRRIIEFCLKNYCGGIFFHFELIPDRLPEQWRDLIKQFPRGSLQFEVGIQTFNPEVAERIERRQNYQTVEENIRFLRFETDAYLHTDLIVGLPGEDLESFAKGFDRLVKMRPQEIQVGILKRLKGAPISQHTEEWGMVYNPKPPYDLLKNNLISFSQMQSIKRFARFWDIIANSGNFVKTTELILGKNEEMSKRSPFNEFMTLSQWLFEKIGRTTAISRTKLLELLFEYLMTVKGYEPKEAADILVEDCRRVGFREFPECLKNYGLDLSVNSQKRANGLTRQQKHLC